MSSLKFLACPKWYIIASLVVQTILNRYLLTIVKKRYLILNRSREIMQFCISPILFVHQFWLLFWASHFQLCRYVCTNSIYKWRKYVRKFRGWLTFKCIIQFYSHQRNRVRTAAWPSTDFWIAQFRFQLFNHRIGLFQSDGENWI